MPSVYIAQHIDSHQLYVGKARHWEKRRVRHVADALKNGSETYFHRALRPDVFEWSVLETFESDADAMEAEAPFEDGRMASEDRGL